MTITIAGERSGVGKTTITLALLAYLCRNFDRVQSFKVGPDYIDPMFHSAVTQRPCRNLDPLLTSPTYVKSCYVQNCRDADYAVIEGVMGLFDGVRWPETEKSINCTPTCFSSTACIAKLLELPIILVVDCSRLSGSVAAIVHGYSNLDPQLRVAGVILNKVASSRHLELLEEALASQSLPILGVFYRQDAIALPHRHLGLVPSEEIGELSAIFDRLAAMAAKGFVWEKLLPLLSIKKRDWVIEERVTLKARSKVMRIAVARDQAFNFYYPDNLDILQDLGAELIFWSPLVDRSLPVQIAGLYFGGGFPEVFAAQLSENREILAQIRQSVR
jgi:cobyrinic acid a,c-diamide synthase